MINGVLTAIFSFRLMNDTTLFKANEFQIKQHKIT